jgi:hypothetical protein
MSATTINRPTPHTNASTRESELTLHVGTFADRQRGPRVTVTYSAQVGSLGRAGRK